MKLDWMYNKFISKELFAPFSLKSDKDYLPDLKNRYNIILNNAIKAGADDKSIMIIKKYKKKILKALKCYYNADISKSNKIIKNLIKDIGNNPIAVSDLNHSCAFPGNNNEEIQFFRSRIGNPSNRYSIKDLLYLPFDLRSKSGNYRFSIPGNPSLYLSNSSYGCWIETGFPADNDFNVSPIVLDGTQKIFNLAISIRNFRILNDGDEDRVHCWLKLLMLDIATLYRIDEDNRSFKSEYIISQSIMMACKKLGFDGVAYFSRRVTDEVFAICAINLVLFVDYEKEETGILKHMKMDEPFNFGLFKQLQKSLTYQKYLYLRSVNSPFITNIGSYERQYPYKETRFFDFDNFLFSSWSSETNGRVKVKDDIEWGIILD